ncbi:hypothetical protein BC332_28404 [Capsicum chinense]|nr:hypothetical protein BC332_28404 [Capsicum chinense]
MGKVPPYIVASLIPAVMIAGLYFFNHTVASQMAQQKEFNLKNPSAYHHDSLLLGFMTTVAKELEYLKEAVMRSTENKNRDKAEVTFDTIGESIAGSAI